MESKQHKPTNLNQYKMYIYINKPSPRSIGAETDRLGSRDWGYQYQTTHSPIKKRNQTNNTIKYTIDMPEWNHTILDQYIKCNKINYNQ